MYRLGGPRAPVRGLQNLLKYRKYSALLSGFISNYYLAGFKELLKKKKKKVLLLEFKLETDPLSLQ